MGRIVQIRRVYPHLSNTVLQLTDKVFKVSKQSSFASLLKSATGTTWGQMEEKYTTELWQHLIASEEQKDWWNSVPVTTKESMQGDRSSQLHLWTKNFLLPSPLKWKHSICSSVNFIRSSALRIIRKILQKRIGKYLMVFLYLDNCILENL